MSAGLSSMTDEDLISLRDVSPEQALTNLAAERDQQLRERVEDEKNRQRVIRTAKRELDAEERAPASAKPYDIATVAQVLARPAPPPDRIRVLVPSNAGTLVVAQRKTGKTTFMLNLARCLVTGEDLLDAFATEPVTGKIALLNYEVNAAMIARWASEIGGLGEKLLLVNLRGRRNPLADPQDRAALADHLRAEGVEALIVDTFARAYTGQSHNDAGEVGRFLSDLDTFTREQVEATDLFLTTHAGWNAERTRGSSALEDWADSIITLTTSEQDPDAQRFISSRGRGDGSLDESLLHHDNITRHLSLGAKESRRQAKATAKAEEAMPYVLTALGNTTDLGSDALRAAVRRLGFTGQDQQIRNAARAAESQGKIERIPLGAGKKTLHRLVTPSNPVQPRPRPVHGQGSNPVHPVYV